MEEQDIQDVLHMLDKADISKTCETFIMCEDQI